MESQQPDLQNNEAEDYPLEEIRHIPLWVKGIVIAGVVMFMIQIPAFPKSLSDAIQKKQASEDFEAGHYFQAIEKYSELHDNYPEDIDIIKQLGFAHHRAGQYYNALLVFDKLIGVEMPIEEVELIEATISDSTLMLELKKN